MRRPVNAPYTVTSLHGEYVGSNARFLYHSGYDYAVPSGRAVFAPIGGRITFAGWSNSGGNMIVLFDGVFYHRLMHNTRMHVYAGQQVSEGQHIADAGTTGLSTGPHVHWDICKKEVATAFSDFVDNDPWLKGELNNLYTQGDVMNQESGTELYRTALFREPENAGAAAQWNGQTPAHALRAVRGAEWQSVKSKLDAYNTLVKQVSDLQVALKNEQNKPPQTVIKEVEKVVEKIVTVEKTVLTHDEETKQNVSKILGIVTDIWNYFNTRYQTFRDTLKK